MSLVAFARSVGLDFVELDVLRDQENGQIYVVDANKTSISPPIKLSFRETLRALGIIADAFEYEFFL